MKKIILNIVLLVILSAAALSQGSSLQAQTFSTSKYDSVTAVSRWTWVKLPMGINGIRVKCDSASFVSVAFTGAGIRSTNSTPGTQRKDSLNINATIYKGGTGYFYNRDNDSIGFKGDGKIYYWIDRGQGLSTEIRGGVKSGADSVIVASSADWSKARWDSLYALLGALNRQNGTDSVYMVNRTKDTLTFIDSLKQGDSIRTRDCSGYKYVTAYMISSAGTDTVSVRKYDARTGRYGLVGVYDIYADTKYQLMIPGAATDRFYLLNMPNPGLIRYRRTNVSNLSNITIIVTICSN